MSHTLERKRSRIEDIHEFGLDLDNFIIYLHGVEENPEEGWGEPGVEYRMANRFIKNLDALSGIDEAKPIIISMKTSGGDWTEGMAIYDAIMAVPNPITIISYTHARSMSSIILQAANKRILMPHSYFMFHDGDLSVGGTKKQVKSYTSFDDLATEQMLTIYVDRLKISTGKFNTWSKTKIKNWLVEQMDKREDVYLTSYDAVSHGFADEVFTAWETAVDYTQEQLTIK